MIFVLLLCFLILVICCTNKIPSTIDNGVEESGSLFRFGLDWTTFLKVVLPFIIVVHHIDHHYDHIFPEGISWMGVFLLGNFGIFGAFVVGVFFFISGYGLMSSFQKKGDSYFEGFFRKRFAKLLVPFVLVSTIEQIVRVLVVPGYNVFDSFVRFFTRGEFFVQWFVWVLLQFYVFFYFCFKYVTDKKKAALLLLLCVSLLSLFYFLAYTVPYSLPDDPIGEHWWQSNLCFVIGVFYCIYEDAITKKINGKWKIVISAMAVTIALLTLFVRLFSQLYTLKIVVLIIPVLLVMITYFFKAPKGKIVDFFSKISYETFLVHSIILTLFSYVYRLPSTALTFIAIFIATYLFAWIIHVLCEHLRA